MMQIETLPKVLLAVLVCVAVAAGLALTGGPGTAKAERRDEARMDHLQQLSSHVKCRNREDSSLPETLDENVTCGRNDLVFRDLETDAPYRYRALDELRFEICADFERVDRMFTPNDFDETTGCLTGKIPASS